MTSQGWKSLLTPGSSALARFRADRGTWPELAFQPQETESLTRSGDGAGHAEGTPAGVRTHLLWAIQYDWQPTDLPLLRYLLAQQIMVAEHGATDSAEWLDDLSRAVRLIARGRDESDLLQLYAAVHLLVTNPAQTDESWVSYYSELASLRAGLEHVEQGKMGEGGLRGLDGRGIRGGRGVARMGGRGGGRGGGDEVRGGGGRVGGGDSDRVGGGGTAGFQGPDHARSFEHIGLSELGLAGGVDGSGPSTGHAEPISPTAWPDPFASSPRITPGPPHVTANDRGHDSATDIDQPPAPSPPDPPDLPDSTPGTPAAPWHSAPGVGLLTEPAGDRSIESQVSRAFMAGGAEPAVCVVSEWAANRPENYDSLNTQTDLYASLGEYEAAAEAARRLIELPDPSQPDADLARFEALRRVARLERQSGDLDAAWRSLNEAQHNLAEHPHWREFGPGQSLATEYFLLTAALNPEEPLARAALKVGDRLTRKLGMLDEYLRQVALRAAEHCADERLRRRYARPSA